MKKSMIVYVRKAPGSKMSEIKEMREYLTEQIKEAGSIGNSKRVEKLCMQLYELGKNKTCIWPVE